MGALLDLAAEAELAALWVWHDHSQARTYHDVIVQVSNDPTFANGVTTLLTTTTTTTTTTLPSKAG